VLNEFFNELAYNPGPTKPGFLFFLPWANHDLNSVVGSADANGPLGAASSTSTAKSALLNGVSEINPQVRLLVGCSNRRRRRMRQ